MSSFGSSFTSVNFDLTFMTSLDLSSAIIIFWISSSGVLNFGRLSTVISSFKIRLDVTMENWFAVPFFKSSLGLPSEIMALIRTLVSRTARSILSSISFQAWLFCFLRFRFGFVSRKALALFCPLF